MPDKQQQQQQASSGDDEEDIETMFDVGRMLAAEPEPVVQHEFAYCGFTQRVGVLTETDRTAAGATFAVQGHFLWHSAPVLAAFTEAANRKALADCPLPDPAEAESTEDAVVACLAPFLRRALVGPGDVRAAELGSGAGLTGIVMAQAAGSRRPDHVRVLLTDHDAPVVELLRANVGANSDAARVCSVQTLDWRLALAPGGIRASGALEGDWLGACDLVFAADVLHRFDLYDALFAAAAELLKPGCPLVLVSGLWRYAWDLAAPAAARAGFRVLTERRDDANQAVITLCVRSS